MGRSAGRKTENVDRVGQTLFRIAEKWRLVSKFRLRDESDTTLFPPEWNAVKMLHRNWKDNRDIVQWVAILEASFFNQCCRYCWRVHRICFRRSPASDHSEGSHCGIHDCVDEFHASCCPSTHHFTEK